MDYLWTPWRYGYITTAGKTPGCIFCEALRGASDREAFIAHRGRTCFVMLNAFPYTSGHAMIAPYEHLDHLDKLAPEAATEMMALAQRLETALRRLYRPDGLNLGMNIGASAGAGVAGHVHLHVLPRWVGDTSFMTTTAETRVQPEDLAITWERLTNELAAQ
jgi:ATP adenylyltransferase